MPTQSPNPRLKPPPPSKGYEPARGFPDPKATIVPASLATHRPNPNGGTICGIYPAPSNASHYSMENPTCAGCAQWLDKVRAHTYAKYGAPAEHGSSALEPPPEPETAPQGEPEGTP